MEKDFFVALALVFVIEGLLPFINPAMWRQTMLRMATQADAVLRKMGLASMMIGVALLYLIR